MTNVLSRLLLVVFCMTLIPFPERASAEIIPYQQVAPLPILFVHGYDDKGSSWEESSFYNYVQTLGAKVVSVDYSKYSRNDITSTKINDIFAKAVNELPKGSKFDIVAHSMGGLLTRYHLLDNEDVRNRVRRVIMIGTPNHGSPIAWQNRVSDMIDNPEDYWTNGKKNADIAQYRKYYQEYSENMFDTYGGGKIEEQSYEYWLSVHYPEVITSILQSQRVGAGGTLTNLGTKVLDGGLNYRYSEAFDIYAKILTARSYEREERQAKLGLIYQGVPLTMRESYVVGDDSISKDKQLAEGGFIDEGTGIKEAFKKLCTFNPFQDCDQPATAKNIVQDRLMLERFELHYYDTDNNKAKTSYVVSNLFLDWLWKEESKYRETALKSNAYFPQYITIATVDDPSHKLGRWTTDGFVKNMSAWKYEENDSVVSLKSVTLFHNGKDQFLDRNIKIIPNSNAKITMDQYAIQRSGGYIFHGDQMAAIDLLRGEYNNPLTGSDDREVFMDIVPDAVSSGNGSIVVAKPTNESLGNKYKLVIQSNSNTTVRVIERDRDQMWKQAQEVALLRGDYSGYQAEVDIKPTEKISDYLIVGTDSNARLTVTVRTAEEEQEAYPYYIQTLDTTTDGSTVRHRFRVYDRANDQAVNGLKLSDLVVKLNDQTLMYPRLYAASNTIESASSMMLALDYSGSMETRPRNYSMQSAYVFLKSMVGKTEAKVGVLGFTDQVLLLSGLTTNYELAAKTVYIENTGDTSLNDAIVEASAMLAGEKGRKSILLLTDGEDTSSQHSMEEAIEAAKSHNIAVYVLGLGSVNISAMQQIANETGGKFYFAYEAKLLSELYSTVVTEQDYVYTLEYDSSDLTIENNLTIRMTQSRSNEAEIVYGPVESKQLPKSWWGKFQDFVSDMKGGE